MKTAWCAIVYNCFSAALSKVINSLRQSVVNIGIVLIRTVLHVLLFMSYTVKYQSYCLLNRGDKDTSTFKWLKLKNWFFTLKYFHKFNGWSDLPSKCHIYCSWQLKNPRKFSRKCEAEQCRMGKKAKTVNDTTFYEVCPPPSKKKVKYMDHN